MIHCIFTIDYEIYGSGQGALRELVYDPAEKLRSTFQKYNAKFVAFVEVAELEMIEAEATDPDIDLVKQQIRDFYREGFELGLHLHPQWYKAKYENGNWLLDYSEYNLCALPRERVGQIVDRSIAYFRKVLSVDDFTPIVFRAGNWLFQPAKTVASVLAERGIKVDSSVFKGGIRHAHKLNYRKSIRNGYFWRFTEDAEISVPEGVLLELPIYTQMVPFWQMLNTKRVGLERKGFSAAKSRKSNLYRLMDFFRFRHPLKLDFTRMTVDELTRMMDKVIRDDQRSPALFKPLVAIGHTKDLVDFETVESFLSYLKQKKIAITTFREAYDKCVKG